MEKYSFLFLRFTMIQTQTGKNSVVVRSLLVHDITKAEDQGEDDDKIIKVGLSEISRLFFSHSF